MNSKSNCSNLSRGLLAIGFLLVAACQGIPNSYQGEYRDASGQVKLEFTATGGSIRLADGRELESKIEEFKFDLLKEGKAAIYARTNSRNDSLTDIFWVRPDMKTRQEGGGMMWYEAEILFSLIDSKNNDAGGTITMVHCERGTVLLDLVTSNAQLGCPGGATRLNLKKVEGSGPNPWPPGGGGGN